MSGLDSALHPPRPAADPAPSGENRRFRKFGILIGGLMFALVAIQAVQSVHGVARDRDAILQNALDQGFWIARSLEIGHGLLLEEHKDAMRSLVAEITRHPAVDSLLVVGGDRRVLAASDTTLTGTLWPALPDEPPEYGKVLRSDARVTELAFPAHFAEVSHRIGNAHPDRDRLVDHARWVIVGVNTAAAYAHYRSSVIQSVLLLVVTVVLGCGAFLVLHVFQRLSQLGQIKLGLERFVPRTVRKLIEENPERPMFEKVVRNATVLFLDIERYTGLSEEVSAETLNRIVERYFSVFLDLMVTRGGEINETAGDGIMAIFTGRTPGEHAISAVTAAVAIREQARALNRARAPHDPEIVVNIGINSGTLLLGVTEIKGEAGEHLTYTASGMVTNVAARLCGLGKRGEICLSGATAELVAGSVPLSGPRHTELKNLRDPVAVYRVG